MSPASGSGLLGRVVWVLRCSYGCYVCRLVVACGYLLSCYWMLCQGVV